MDVDESRPPEESPGAEPPPPPPPPGALGEGSPAGEQRTWAVLAHLLGAAGFLTVLGMLGWVGPLVIWLTQRRTSRFVAFHALQSLFFQLFAAAAATLARLVAFFLPWVLLPALLIGLAVVLAWSVVAAIRTNNGEWYQYPVAGQWALEHCEV